MWFFIKLYFLALHFIPMLEYTRFVRKKDTGDPIKWIEIVSLDQLDPLNHFDNKINPTVYYAQPEIDENCSKFLRTPLSSFHDFMKPILQSVVSNTTEHLRLLSKKRTSYEEIVDLIMVSMAVVVCSSKFQHFQKSVGNLRQFMKTEHGLSAKWKGVNR